MPDLMAIPGVGKATVAKLQRLGITDTDGLLTHLPRRYLDLWPVPIHAIDDESEWVTVKGRVTRAHARSPRDPIDRRLSRGRSAASRWQGMNDPFATHHRDSRCTRPIRKTGACLFSGPG